MNVTEMSQGKHVANLRFKYVGGWVNLKGGNESDLR